MSTSMHLYSPVYLSSVGLQGCLFSDLRASSIAVAAMVEGKYCSDDTSCSDRSAR